jgi:Terminase large subunit, T4likevirus-type, N-terminal
MGATGLRDDLALALDPARLMAACGWPPDPWQAQVLRSPAARLLLLACRQSGKSTTTACLALHTALYEPGALILLLSPSLRQSQELFRKVQDAYRALGHPAPLEAESALRFEMANGSRIIALPGTEPTIRGYSGVNLLVIDEAARVADELYYAIRPMLAVSGGRLIGLSTPWGKRGWFYAEWERGEGWERTTIPAAACPRIPAAFLEEERRSLPRGWFDAEYLCLFTDTDMTVFREEDLQAMLDPTVEPWDWLAGGAYAHDHGL